MGIYCYIDLYSNMFLDHGTHKKYSFKFEDLKQALGYDVPFAVICDNDVRIKELNYVKIMGTQLHIKRG